MSAADHDDCDSAFGVLVNVWHASFMVKTGVKIHRLMPSKDSIDYSAVNELSEASSNLDSKSPVWAGESLEEPVVCR